MSERWQQHMAMLQRFFDQQPKSTPTIYPRVPPPAQSAELPADMFSGEMAENMGFGAAPQGGTSPVVGYAAPSVMALAQTADINPGLARAGLAGLGMAHPAVGLGLGLGNTAANAVNTSANLDMLNGLGVSPSGWQGLGGLIGTNPLAGTYTGALNWAMADQLPGFAGMSVEQVPGDVTGSKFEAEIADIAAAMGPTADSAPRGDVVAEPLADLPGFASGGYTGAGADGVVQPWRPAGVVHEGEMVIPAWLMRGLLGMGR